MAMVLASSLLSQEGQPSSPLVLLLPLPLPALLLLGPAPLPLLLLASALEAGSSPAHVHRDALLKSASTKPLSKFLHSNFPASHPALSCAYPR